MTLEEIYTADVKSFNVGTSDYSTHNIQPWDIWEEYNLDPWRADIIKRILRKKDGDDTITDLAKIIHICRFIIDKELRERQNKVVEQPLSPEVEKTDSTPDNDDMEGLNPDVYDANEKDDSIVE